MPKNLTVLIVFILGLFACKPKEYSPSEYVQWIKNPTNGLLLSKEVGDYAIRLQYKPHEYLALLDSKGETLSDADFETLSHSYEGMDYYNLGISLRDKSKDILKEGIQSPNDYFQRVNYFSFKVGGNITAISGTDTLPCKLCHFERNYGLSPDCNLSIGFERQLDPNKPLRIIYDDEILGIGKVEFNISNTALTKLPTLKNKHQ